MLHTPAAATEYKYYGELGTGTYGIVVKAIHVETRKLYAIKRLKTMRTKGVQKASMRTYKNPLRGLCHAKLPVCCYVAMMHTVGIDVATPDV